MDSYDSRWDDHQPNSRELIDPGTYYDLFETENPPVTASKGTLSEPGTEGGQRRVVPRQQLNHTHSNQGFCGRPGHTNSNKESMNNTQSINMIIHASMICWINQQLIKFIQICCLDNFIQYLFKTELVNFVFASYTLALRKQSGSNCSQDGSSKYFSKGKMSQNFCPNIICVI